MKHNHLCHHIKHSYDYDYDCDCDCRNLWICESAVISLLFDVFFCKADYLQTGDSLTTLFFLSADRNIFLNGDSDLVYHASTESTTRGREVMCFVF